MRIASSSRYAWLALAVLPGWLAAAEPAVEYAGGSIAYGARGANTILSISTTTGHHYQLQLARDSTVAPAVPPRSLQILGQVASKLIILTDAYPSIPGGMSYCQAGEEKFLRVIRLSAASAVEKYRTKLESCRQNLELATPGVEWRSTSRTLTVHWLSGPGGIGQAQTLMINIHANKVTVHHQLRP
jgi:hypothetical protein